VLALHKFPLTKPLADKFRENVSGSRDGRPDWVLTIGQGSGEGLFGPNSAVWQVHGTIATLVGEFERYFCRLRILHHSLALLSIHGTKQIL
jgi:hypothetical protein